MSRFSSRRVAAVLLRHFYLMRGSPARVVPLFAWVAVDIVLWGFIARWFGVLSGRGPSLVPVLLGAVLLWDFFTRVMHGVTMAFLEDVWSRNFLNLFSTPITVAEYVVGLVLSSLATSLVGLGAMLLLASLGFGLSFLSYGLALLPFLLVLFGFGVALGILAVALVLRLGPAAEWFVWPMPALLAPFVGVFYPVSTLPGWMRAIAAVLPPSPVFEGLRAVVAGGPVPWGSLGLGAALCAAWIALAAWAYAAVHRHAVRTGLIGRYSAETVS